jgi:hypothetical protein
MRRKIQLEALIGVACPSTQVLQQRERVVALSG